MNLAAKRKQDTRDLATKAVGAASLGGNRVGMARDGNGRRALQIDP